MLDVRHESLMPMDWGEAESAEKEVEEAEDNATEEQEETAAAKQSDEDYAESNQGRSSDEEEEGEDEEDGEDEDGEEAEDGLTDESEEASGSRRREKKPLSKREMRELMEAAGEVRRSGRQRTRVQRLELGAEEGSDSDAGGRQRKPRRGRATFESEPSEPSESEYEDRASRRSRPARKAKRGGRSARRRARIASSDSDSFDSDAARFSTRRAANKTTNYKEAESDEEINEDDVLEWDEGDGKPGTSGEPEPHTETIEKILNHRFGRKGAIGSTTTLYAVEDNGDPNADFSGAKDEGEKQYLIKWQGWAHVHNTWETRSGLESMGVKGQKKLENYIQRTREVDRWKRRADKDSVEYWECEDEMSRQLLEDHKRCERIVCHQRKGEEEEAEYYVKWAGLPYAECTWEEARLCRRWFEPQIQAYHDRRRSKTVPRFAAGRGNDRFRLGRKFAVLKEQPQFLKDGGILRDYQLEGVNWLLAAYAKDNSCILADEMGLGKTIQTIAFLGTLVEEYSVFGPFLIIVPLSTMAAWQREFANWAPRLNVITYLGDVSSRQVMRTHEWTATTSSSRPVANFNACLTTYEILLKDKAFISQLDWACIAVDEAHRLKNHESQLYKSLQDFRSPHRLLITGTPLQNSLKELWALLHFIMPNLFESWDDFDYRHGRGEQKGYKSIHQELEPFLLRRIKKDVEKSLPAKVEQILRVEMTKTQKQYYKWVLTKNFKELSKGVQKGSQSTLLNIMMELKKCCNHAYLVKPPDPEDEASEEKLIRASGKLMLLHKLLRQLKDKGHRVLIFSQMVMMLDIVQEYLQHERFAFQRLDGTMRGELRRQAMDHFNEPGSSDFAFLLSTKAGGLGLNLATADTVIILDSDWNPQNDLQAQSRAHRIGQKRQVNIYRLVTKNSVEEDIIERAKRKLVLDHLVIQRMDTTGRTVLARNAVGSASSNPFNKEELSNILKFGAAELFKEKEGEEVEAEVDIDDILQRAETRAEAAGGQAEELLSAFKVANFAIDESEALLTRDKTGCDWDAIIPEDDRRHIQAEQDAALQQQLSLGPRQRNKVLPLNRNDQHSDDDWKEQKKKARGRRRKASDSDSDSDDDDDDRKRGSGKGKRKVLFGFTEAEVKRFIRTFRKFALPRTRLEAIGNDAGLEDHSVAEIRQLVDALLRAYKDSLELAGTEETGEASRKGGPSFKFGGLEVAVRAIQKAQWELEPLYALLPRSVEDRRRWELPTAPKAQRTWGCDWEERDDAALLRGVYEYGYGSWEAIKMDPQLGLTDKLLPVDKKQKPQTNHIVSRADYLLRLVAKHHRGSSATAPAATAAQPSDNGVSEEPKAKKPRKSAPSESALPAAKKEAKKDGKKEKENKGGKKEKPKGPTPAEVVESVSVNVAKFGQAMEDSSSSHFQECVKAMKPVKKAIGRALNPSSDRPEDFNDNLIKVCGLLLLLY